jgi:hypothetical protein
VGRSGVLAIGEVTPEAEERVELRREFARQVDTLLTRGYPELARLDEEAFLRHLEPLQQSLPRLPARSDEGRVDFVIVVTGELVRPHEAVQLVELRGKRGFTSMEGADLERFTSIAGVEAPRGPAYLVVDVDTGPDALNVTPDAALETIVRAGRSPLTIAEGVALVTHFPDLLEKRNAFSILGSRCGDRRVTAIWLSGGRPRLGWCWAGNPHSWLGSASCGARISQLSGELAEGAGQAATAS